MDSQSTQQGGSSKPKGRRVWKKSEEEALLRCMINEYSDKWSADNGFKPSFFTLLEKEMKKVLSTSDLKANPHIDSKIRYWKQTYHKVYDIVNLSGFGWDDTTKRIVVDERVWEEYEKAHPKKVNGIYGKSFPYYDQWCIVFGKDRATGEGAEDPAQMAQVDPMEDENNGDFYYPHFGDEFLFASASENHIKLSDSPPTTTPPTSAPPTATPHSSLPTSTPQTSIPLANSGIKKGKKRTRMSDNELAIHESMDDWLKETKGQLGDIAKSLSYSNNLSARRENVPNELEKLNLTDLQRFKLGAVICANEERIDNFYGIKEHLKQLWAEAVLNGEVYGPI